VFELETGLIFLFGAMLGSFLNVCIYRLPRQESVVWPGSHCPACKAPIPIWYNIPIISYLLLRGKCHTCKSAIPVTYPLVEILTGVFLVVTWRSFGLSLAFLHYSTLILLLLPVSFIDLDTKLILNVLTLPGLLCGLAFSFFLRDFSFVDAILGVVIGGGFLWVVGVVGEWLFKQESMGGGDVKLGAMIGAFLGPKVIVVLFLAFFLALPVIAIGLGMKRLKVGSQLPFGPFISLSAVIIVYFGPFLFEKYVNLVWLLKG